MVLTDYSDRKHHRVCIGTSSMMTSASDIFLVITYNKCVVVVMTTNFVSLWCSSHKWSFRYWTINVLLDPHTG